MGGKFGRQAPSKVLCARSASRGNSDLSEFNMKHAHRPAPVRSPLLPDAAALVRMNG